MRHTFIRLFLVLVLTVSVYAQAQQRAVENSPGVERLRAHVTHLASDELEGRRTGTMGADKAARYIAGEFARQGLRPASKLSVGTNSRNESSPRADAYLQSFPFVAGVEAGRNNRMLFTPAVATEARDASRAASLDLRFGEDWMPLAWSANGNLDKLPVTFAGYGIKADALGWNDYANLDLKDRIVLIFTGTPDADNPHSEFAAYADLRRKAATAREQGARALVVVAKEENFKDDRLARLRFDHAGGGSVDAGLPVVVVSRASARRILENGGVALPLNELEKSLATLRNKNNPTGAQGSQPPHAARPNLSLALKSGALSIQIEVLRREVPAATVVGVLEGADARLKSEAIIIGAHYDPLGRGGAGSLAARGEDERGEIHHGADDNASGVAALLELASAFASAREKPRRTIIFIAFGGEEEGLLGSNYYVNHPVVPLAQIVAMINMDMIGRMKDNKLIVGGVGTAAEWRSIVHRANDELRLQLATGGRSGNRNSQNQSARNNVLVVGANGETVATAAESERFSLTLNEDGFGPSDHASFYAKRIPVLFFFTGTHVDYHKPSDTAEKINYDATARIASFVHDVVRHLDERDERLTYQTARSDGATRATPGFRVFLGTIPNYSDTSDGVLIDGVRENSPAERAGLKAGDRIVRMAGRGVRNVYDYTYALAEMRAGQSYEVEVVREGKRLQLRITPEARK